MILSNYECDCGKHVSKVGGKFIVGRNGRGKKRKTFSDEHRANMSKAQK